MSKPTDKITTENDDFSDEDLVEIGNLIAAYKQFKKTGRGTKQYTREFLSSKELEQKVDDITTKFSSNPNLLERARKLQATQDVTDRVSQGLGALQSAIETGVSIRQISQSNRAINRLRRPDLPQVPGRDETLSNALYEAGRGTYDPSVALGPAQAGMREAYAADMNAAQTASAGQAGAYGAYGQAAANRMQRGARDLAPMGQEILMENTRRYDNLLGERLNENQRNFSNQMGVTGLAVDQYNRDIDAAGNLGAVGRRNLYQSLGNLGEDIAPMVGNYLSNRQGASRQPLPEIQSPAQSKTSYSALGPDFDNMKQGITDSLRKRFSRDLPNNSSITSQSPYYNPNIRIG
jgi:hypothetical protein